MLGITARFIDVFAVALGAVIAHRLRYTATQPWMDTETLLLAFQCVLVLLMFPAFGIYQSWRGKPFRDLAWRVTGAWALITFIGLLLVFSLRKSEDVSRVWFASSTVMACLMVIVEKALVHFWLRRLRIRGLNQKQVVIVAARGYSRSLITQMQHSPQAGFRPAAVFDESTESDDDVDGVPVMHSFRKLSMHVRNEGIDEIWLALPLSEERTIMRFLREFRHDFVNLRFMPDVRSMSLFNHSVSEVLGIPAINLAASPVTELEIWPKLVFDRLFAAAVLLMMLPLFVGIAIMVKASSPGPVLFRQRRKGIDGREFDIFKFRSMKVHAEQPGTITQASRRDPRITPIGAFLRRTSLDELPQFINVLLGEMSVVGPRPHALAHDDLYKDLVDGYMHRYRIRPGITGWAQVNGYRGETTKVEKMEQRVKFDLFYIQNWSFWFDMKIVVITMFKGFVGRNAY
jgi:putative colanic acid biosynthesis UDP-glucose lipid carrier transferase